MTPAEMQRRILDLERRVLAFGTGGAPGISTAYGATSVAYRDRFPVELTSEFDAATGYSWQRIRLERTTTSGSFVTSTAAQTGENAHTPDNDTTLPIGTRGWLEADPTAAGWVFLKSNPGAASAGGCSAINAGMNTDDCLKVTVVSTSGLCSTIDDTQEVYLAWDAGDSRWESGASDWTSTGSGGTGAVHFWFDEGYPKITIDGQYGTPEGCENGGLLFSFGGATLCAGGTQTTCEDYFVVRVECSCCPLDGWDGEAWYCVVNAGDTCGVDQQYCVELLEEDICDTDIVICSGPHTEEECLAACTGATSGVTVACCANVIPETVYAHIGSTTGSCGTSLTASIPLVYDSVSGTWKQTDYGLYGTDLTLSCSGSNWVLNSTRSFGGGVATSTTCSPLSIVFPVFNGGLACTGTFVVTVTASA